MSYSRDELKAPVLSGAALRGLAWLLERPIAGAPARAKILADAKLIGIRDVDVGDHSSLMPLLGLVPDPEAPGSEQESLALAEHAGALSQVGSGFRFPSVADYAQAYRSGQTDPVAVAERAIEAIEASNSGERPIRAIIALRTDDLRRQAAESARRLAEGKPRSVLEGVPVAVKDEVDMVPYPTTVGTAFLGSRDALIDATTVERLRSAGALLIGKANMHELGIGVTGLNPHHGVCRNPYDRSCHTGGSSSGSAAAVAAGLAPLALGADGGGSIRIPSAFCGVFGLKCTFGRVSEHGAAPLCWTEAHIGPIGATAADVAIGYAIMAGRDPRDPGTQAQPPVHLTGLGTDSIEGLRIGVYEPWFRDAHADVVRTCEAAIDRLVARGAKRVSVDLPSVEAIRKAHVITIASEMLAGQLPNLADHSHEYGLDVRINFALAREFRAMDYAQAQRIRSLGYAEFSQAFEQADVIATPTSAITAPRIPEHALPDGESNLELLSDIMRFAAQGNHLGLPGISVPVGYSDGLPVGLQFLGRPWAEAGLLRIARVLEAELDRTRPRAWWDLLDTSTT